MNNLSALKLNVDDVDGISFSLDDSITDKTKEAWIFTMMKLNERSDELFTKNDIGYKYQILLYKEDNAEVFEAVIGDLFYYIDGLMRVKQEGMIIKKCSKSEEILNKIFKGKLAEALEDGEVRNTKEDL